MSLRIVKTIDTQPEDLVGHRDWIHNAVRRAVSTTRAEQRGQTRYSKDHISNYHLFFNYDFTNLAVRISPDSPHYRWQQYVDTITPGEHVHIFISRENPSMYNHIMRAFIEKVAQASGSKVIVHIPKSRPALKDYIEHVVGDPEWMDIIFENPKQVWFFRKSYTFGRREFRVVMWDRDYIITGLGRTNRNSDNVTLSNLNKML